MGDRRNSESDSSLGDMEMIFDDDNEEVGGEELPFSKNVNSNNTSGSDTNKIMMPLGDNEQVRSSSNVRVGAGLPGTETRSMEPSVAAPSGGEELKIHSWDGEAAEKGIRQTMILEIARLLKSRKKTQPSNDWLQQLPHKARKLEERLYRAAPSLSSYQDLSTLKYRLQMVAQMITNQYAAAKRRHSFAMGGTRRLSGLSAISDFRNSFTTTPTHRDSILTVNSNSTGMLNQQPIKGTSAFMTVSTQNGGDASGSGNSEGAMAAMQTSSSTGKPETGTGELRQVAEAAMGLGNPGHTALIASNSGQQPIGQTTNPQFLNQQQQSLAAFGSESGGGAVNANGTSMLEQQKALNERLRLQIQENIRRQNEWFRQMQQSQQPPSQQGSGNSTPASISNSSVVEQAQENYLQQNPSLLSQIAQGGSAPTAGQSSASDPSSLNQFGAMANMTKHMAAMGLAAGIQQQQQLSNMSQSGMAGFQFGSNSPASAAALMNNPSNAAQLQALLLQQQQQGIQNPMTMLASRMQQQQQSQFAQAQQIQQRMALGLQHQQQQLLEKAPKSSPNTSVNNTMQPPPPGSSSATVVSSQKPNDSGNMATSSLLLQKVPIVSNAETGGTATTQAALNPSNPNLSPGSFHW